MKTFIFLMMLAVLVLVTYQIQPAFSAKSKSDSNLVGSWKMIQKATDSEGKPCSFVPEVFDFFIDKTVVLSNFGSAHLPYTTSVTPEEKQIIEKRVPELKGKNLLLIKPNPNMGWTNTPMVYAYEINKNKLSIILQGFSPATFEKK